MAPTRDTQRQQLLSTSQPQQPELRKSTNMVSDDARKKFGTTQLSAKGRNERVDAWLKTPAGYEFGKQNRSNDMNADIDRVVASLNCGKRSAPAGTKADQQQKYKGDVSEAGAWAQVKDCSEGCRNERGAYNEKA